MLTANHAIKIASMVLCVVLIAWYGTAHAAVKIFEREYIYQAGDVDSKISSRIISLEQVKKLLLEELGTAIISETIVVNSQLTKDEITSIAGGYVKTVIVDESWDGKTYKLKARIEADPEEVLQFVKRVLSDKERAKDLKNTSKQKEVLARQLETLKEDMRKNANEEKAKRYNDLVNKLAVLDLSERVFALAEGKNLNDPKIAEEKKPEILEIIDTYTKIIKIMPDWSLAYQMRMLFYSLLKEHDKALEDINSALKYNNWNINGVMREDIGPDELPQIHIDLRKQKAYALLKLGKSGECIKELESLIKIEPHLRFDDWFWSVKDFNYLVETYPKDHRVYLIHGIYYSDNRVLDNKKYVELAIKDFRKAMSINPDEALPFYLLAYEYFTYSGLTGEDSSKQKKENARKSRQLLLKAAKLTWTSAVGRSIYDLLASNYSDAGEYDKALNAYNKAIQIDPDYGDIYLGKARLYRILKKHDKAINEYGNALSSKKKITTGMRGSSFINLVLYLRADASYEAGRYADAVRDYTQVIDSKIKDLVRDGLDPFEYLSLAGC